MSASLELREPVGKVTVMPDFYIDRSLLVTSLDSLWKKVLEKAKSGGGNILGTRQAEGKGGNAVNLAYALGRLGVKASLITVADKFGKGVLSHTFSDLPVKVRTVEGRQGYTVALEFPHDGRIVNAMINDIGSLPDFGPEKLRKGDWREVAESKVVGILNWAVNLKGGELMKAVFSFASKKGALTFLDPSDITIRGTGFIEVMDLARSTGYPEVLSINENEARAMAKLLGVEPLPLTYTLTDVDKMGDLLSRELGITIDLHAPIGSSSHGKYGRALVRSFKVRQRVSTGAGDSWNAGNIFGYLNGMNAEERLVIANACGAIYVSQAESTDREELSEFLENRAY